MSLAATDQSGLRLDNISATNLDTITTTSISTETLSLTSTNVALGFSSGTSPNGVAIGNSAGISQGAKCVAIGWFAGSATQAASGVAIGVTAGQTTQGTSAIAIGTNAGNATQGSNGIALGANAGLTTQGSDSIGIGTGAGKTTQGGQSVAIGANCALTSQANFAVAVGSSAGRTSQGTAAVAIGQNAGFASQHANSIIVSATGVAVNSDGTSRCYIDPIRNVTSANYLYYNPTTKEVTSSVIPYYTAPHTGVQNTLVTTGTIVLFSGTATTQGTIGLSYSAGVFTNNSGTAGIWSVSASYGHAGTTLATASTATMLYGTSGSPTNELGYTTMHCAASTQMMFNVSVIVSLAASEVFQLMIYPGSNVNGATGRLNRISILKQS